MRTPLICVAGLTREGRHVRPLPTDGHLDRGHLQTQKGSFSVGAVVELGDVEDVGVAPEHEDRLVDLGAVRYEFHLDEQVFWRFLLKVSRGDLKQIFGSEIRPVGASMTLPLGRGEASLGCLLPSTPPVVYLDQHERVRLKLKHDESVLHLPVTDIRLYGVDEAVHMQRLTWLNRTMATGCVLSVGLGRPYKGGTRPEAEHWLQVNNVHPKADPLWSSAPNP